MKRFLGEKGSYLWSEVKGGIVGQFNDRGQFETEDDKLIKELSKRYDSEEVTNVTKASATVEDEVEEDEVEEDEVEEDEVEEDELSFDELSLQKLSFKELKATAKPLGFEFQFGMGKSDVIDWLMENQK